MAPSASRLIPFFPFALAMVLSAAAGGAISLSAFAYAIGFVALIIGQLMWVKTHRSNSIANAITLYALTCSTSLAFFVPSLASGRMAVSQVNFLSTLAWAGALVLIVFIGQWVGESLRWRRSIAIGAVAVLAAALTVGVMWGVKGSRTPPLGAAVLPFFGYWPGVADALHDKPINVDLPTRREATQRPH
ncbi:hypothetical protein [Stenotrophomonas cyclobalanopsidis]|uniref:hypothetical protein n=1 Tax=Stenotrophomonas cyclobalanopsidis TaxID=2771362 RepID=UPI00345FDD8A